MEGFFKQALSSNSKMTLEEAIFRSEVAFKSANLQECRQFWEEEILKEGKRTIEIVPVWKYLLQG